MPSMKLAVPHQLTQEEATARLERFMDRVREKYQDQVTNLEHGWVGSLFNFGFTTRGMSVKGNMAVEPSEVKVDGQIPFAAMMFKGKIEQTIRDELTRVLSDRKQA